MIFPYSLLRIKRKLEFRPFIVLPQNARVQADDGVRVVAGRVSSV